MSVDKITDPLFKQLYYHECPVCLLRNEFSTRALDPIEHPESGDYLFTCNSCGTRVVFNVLKKTAFILEN